MRVNVKVDTRGFDRKVANLKANTPSATATALNRTGIYAQHKEEDETRRVFNAPTPYTQRAFSVRWASKNNLLAQVAVRNQGGGRLSPDHWLYAEVEGGARGQKAFERALSGMGFLGSGESAVPTRNASLDSFGNVSSGTIRSILTQLQRQSATFVGPNRRQRRGSKTAQYFAVPSGQKSGNLTPGIYQRTGRGIKQIMVFMKGLPRYTKRLDFYGVGKQAAQDRFPIEMRLAMKQTIDLA